MIDNNTGLDELPAEMAETLTAFFRAKSPSTSPARSSTGLRR